MLNAGWYNDVYQSMMIVSLTLWWQYGKYHPASDEGIEKQNSISSNMNDISSCEGDSCYFTLHLLDDTDMLSRISSVIMSHRVHIQTIPWDAERKHISNRSHDRCGWYISTSHLDWDREHIHMLTHIIQQMLSICTSCEYVPYVVSILLITSNTSHYRCWAYAHLNR